MSILTSLIGPVTGLLDKVIPDKSEAARLAHEIATMGDKLAHEQILAQLEVNKVEAAGNWFGREFFNIAYRGWIWHRYSTGRNVSHDAGFNWHAWSCRNAQF